MSNWTPENEHLAAEGYDSEGVESVEESKSLTFTGRESFAELRGTVCLGCGGTKATMKSHCRVCYFRLPVHLQRDLYKKIGQGYEEALAESVRYLARLSPRKQKGGIPPMN